MIRMLNMRIMQQSAIHRKLETDVITRHLIFCTIGKSN